MNKCYAQHSTYVLQNQLGQGKKVWLDWEEYFYTPWFWLTEDWGTKVQRSQYPADGQWVTLVSAARIHGIWSYRGSAGAKTMSDLSWPVNQHLVELVKEISLKSLCLFWDTHYFQFISIWEDNDIISSTPWDASLSPNYQHRSIADLQLSEWCK